MHFALRYVSQPQRSPHFLRLLPHPPRQLGRRRARTRLRWQSSRERDDHAHIRRRSRNFAFDRGKARFFGREEGPPRSGGTRVVASHLFRP